ncbi:uncharacterized protein PSFLO_00472 [Pseudozyma flocculosa]|uniref:Uncharacterized protein n=1 Tax=Pseudozyma flocculosa TaxID=84751 RepID=A0A5C3EV99_9BASI|nr:uncharacterized protein PSFLO_00472 [Pseudozyma flocculosa]
MTGSRWHLPSALRWVGQHHLRSTLHIITTAAARQPDGVTALKGPRPDSLSCCVSSRRRVPRPGCGPVARVQSATAEGGGLLAGDQNAARTDAATSPLVSLRAQPGVLPEPDSTVGSNAGNTVAGDLERVGQHPSPYFTRIREARATAAAAARLRTKVADVVPSEWRFGQGM